MKTGLLALPRYFKHNIYELYSSIIMLYVIIPNLLTHKWIIIIIIIITCRSW